MMNLITKILFPLCLLLPMTTLGETMDDLVERDGLYYQKFTNVPFTGEVTGKTQRKIKESISYRNGDYFLVTVAALIIFTLGLFLYLGHAQRLIYWVKHGNNSS